MVTIEQRRQKREERREKREERREKREERREKIKRLSFEQQHLNDRQGLRHAAPWWDLWRLRGQREESREKREERRDKREHVFFLFFVERGRGLSQG